MRRPMPASLCHPIKPRPLPKCLYPALGDVFVVLLTEVRILLGGHIVHRPLERCWVSRLATCFEAGELIQNHPHDGALAPELFVCFSLESYATEVVFKTVQALVYAPHLLPPPGFA